MIRSRSPDEWQEIEQDGRDALIFMFIGIIHMPEFLLFKRMKIYLIIASNRLFTSSQFTMFQKASTNLGLSFL